MSVLPLRRPVLKTEEVLDEDEQSNNFTRRLVLIGSGLWYCVVAGRRIVRKIHEGVGRQRNKEMKKGID